MAARTHPPPGVDVGNVHEGVVVLQRLLFIHHVDLLNTGIPALRSIQAFTPQHTFEAKAAPWPYLCIRKTKTKKKYTKTSRE